jgi:hypothetical protein
MKRLSNPVVSLLSIALVLSLAGAASGAKERPLKLKGTTSIVSGDPFSPAGALTEGTGTGTHLGRFQSIGTVFFSPGEGEEAGFTVGEGTQTFIAANGDELHTEFRGLLDSEGNATIDVLITGGTGRFEDAEGEFVVEATAGAPGVFDFTGEGVIEF